MVAEKAVQIGIAAFLILGIRSAFSMAPPTSDLPPNLPVVALPMPMPAPAPLPSFTPRPPLSPLSGLQRELRLQHAHELLGKFYARSVVRHGEQIKKVNSKIYHIARERLPKKYRARYKEVAQTIIDESFHYEMDPVLLVSVILGESSFNPDCKGPFDEIGLMQVRPDTGEWISGLYGLPWKGEKTLRDPIANIRIGAAYLNHLRTQFDSHARLYLAAYNMGARNVSSALEKKVWPKDYPIHVMRRYVGFYEQLTRNKSAN